MFLCVKKRAKSALIQLILRTRTTALCASPRATDDGCCVFFSDFSFCLLLSREKGDVRVFFCAIIIKSPQHGKEQRHATGN
jgi:hypothetical protein